MAKFSLLSTSSSEDVAQDYTMNETVLPVPPMAVEAIPFPSEDKGKAKELTAGPSSPLSRTSSSPSHSSSSTTSLRRSTFVSSPLNPNHSPLRVPSIDNEQWVRVTSEETRALTSPHRKSDNPRASMILYHLPSFDDSDSALLVPPRLSDSRRDSYAADSGSSFVSMSPDSKYPWHGVERGDVVPYAYDASLEILEAEDALFDEKEQHLGRMQMLFSMRGIATVTMILVLVLGFMALMIAYPVVSFYKNRGIRQSIVVNTFVNSTGQGIEIDFAEQ